MAVSKTSTIPVDKLELYEKLVATNPNVERKGASVPYTSRNGHMFSYLNVSGIMALKLPKDARDKFLKNYKTKLFEAYGAVQKEFVTVPDTSISVLSNPSQPGRRSLNASRAGGHFRGAPRSSGPPGSEWIAQPGVPHHQPGQDEGVKNITRPREDPCKYDCRSIDAIRDGIDGYQGADGLCTHGAYAQLGMSFHVESDDEARDICQDQIDSIDRNGDWLKRVAPQERGGERHHTDKQQPDQVQPHESTVNLPDLAGRPVMRKPVQANDEETQHVCANLRQHPYQGRTQGRRLYVWYPEVEDEQRNDDRIHAISKGFQPLLVHTCTPGMKSSIRNCLP